MNLDTALAMVLKAVAKAESMNLRVSVTVVDDNGNDLASVRMDDATPFTAGLSRAKARTAAVMRRDTEAVAVLDAAHPEILDLIAEQVGFTPTTLKGGLVIKENGKVIGAIGVSGASSDEDVVCGEAAMA